MSAARSFHIGDIISITHDVLISPRLMDGVYDILNFMTGDNLYTHALPRAGAECKPHLLAQHPDLADISLEGVVDWRGKLKELVDVYGETRDVLPLPTGAHHVIDPMKEAQQMMGSADRVVLVVKA